MLSYWLFSEDLQIYNQNSFHFPNQTHPLPLNLTFTMLFKIYFIFRQFDYHLTVMLYYLSHLLLSEFSNENTHSIFFFPFFIRLISVSRLDYNYYSRFFYSCRQIKPATFKRGINLSLNGIILSIIFYYTYIIFIDFSKKF